MADAATPPALNRERMKVPKAAEIVADRVRADIVAGTLKPGDSLPAEARLLEQYGVSRPTLREAFRILEAQRLVAVSRGARGGAIICGPDPELIGQYSLLVLQAERTTVAEVFDTRRLLEPGIVREVALRGHAQASQRLHQALQRERALLEEVVPLAGAVADFHRTLIELSNNRPVMHMLRAITGVIEKHQAMVMMRERHGSGREQNLAYIEMALRSQEKLIDLIAARDGEAAEAHWRRHVDNSHQAFIAGYEQLTIYDLMQR